MEMECKYDSANAYIERTNNNKSESILLLRRSCRTIFLEIMIAVVQEYCSGNIEIGDIDYRGTR